MKIAYGPPGERGVTTLMAVGDADIDQTPTDQAVRVGAWIGVATFGIGIIAGSKTIRNLGLGGAIALFAVRAITNGGQQVAVTAPAPASASATTSVPTPTTTSDYY